jgi:hypothetical protein
MLGVDTGQSCKGMNQRKRERKEKKKGKERNKERKRKTVPNKSTSVETIGASPDTAMWTSIEEVYARRNSRKAMCRRRPNSGADR